MTKILECIVNGVFKLVKIVAFVVLLWYACYGLTYFLDLNTREIFLRITSIMSILFLLYNVGKK